MQSFILHTCNPERRLCPQVRRQRCHGWHILGMKSKKEPDSSERALLLRLLDANLPESPPHDVSRSSRKVSFRTSAVPRRGRQATSVRALATKFNALSETHPTATTKVTLGRRASREEPRRRAAVAVAGNVKAAIRIFEQGAEDATPPAKRASELPHANAPGAKHYCVVSNGDDACDEDGFRPCTTVERLSSQPKPKTVLQGSETYVRTVRRETKLTVAEVVAIDAQVLDEDDEYEAIQVPSMLPNSSFLWRSSKIPASTASAPDDYDDVQPYESEDTLYDDVGQPDSDGYEYCDDVVEYDDCNIYDDVRTDAQQDLYEPIYGAAEVAAPSCSSNSSCDQSNSLYGVASTVYAGRALYCNNIIQYGRTTKHYISSRDNLNVVNI